MKNPHQPISAFEAHGGVANASQLLEEGVTYYQLKELLATGQVVKLKRGLYRWTDVPVSEMEEVAHIVKKGVYCLFSAAAHHDLTTFVSSEYHLAVPKKYKVVLPEYPPIKLYYWQEAAYQTGIIKVEIEGEMVAMYDAEKTVCDIVKYQKKVGMDTLKEVLNTYLRRKDRNIHKLSEYASVLKIKEEVNSLLTLLV
jgi:predicted transcriptional regulator of viral defense system